MLAIPLLLFIILLPSADQLLNLNPGTINSIAFFRLNAKSPAMKAARVIKNNGGKDYWGNMLQIEGKQNIGADGREK